MKKVLIVPLSSKTDVEFQRMLEAMARLPPKWTVADVATDEESDGTRIVVIVVRKGSLTRKLIFPLSVPSAAEFDAFIEEWEKLKPRWRLIGVDRAIDSGVPVARFTIERVADEGAESVSDSSTAPAKRALKTKRAAPKAARNNARSGGS